MHVGECLTYRQSTRCSDTVETDGLKRDLSIDSDSSQCSSTVDLFHVHITRVREPYLEFKKVSQLMVC